MRNIHWLWAGVLATAALAGCKTVECGEGTVEENGECVGGEAPDDTCGPGTTRDPVSLLCLNDLIDASTGLCGPNTIREVDPVTGIATCVGTGGGEGCGPKTCPQATAGKVNVCGRVYTVHDSKPIDDRDAPTGAWSAVKVKVYQPLVFVTNPSADPLVVADTDECGRYEVTGLDAATLNGLVAVAVDDNPDTGANDYILTGVAAIVQAGKAYTLNAWVTQKTTDDGWSTGTSSYATRGVFMPIFIDPKQPNVAPFKGTPVAGVQIVKGATPIASQDFYFTDTVITEHLTVDSTGAQDKSGANGAGFSLDRELTNYSGAGNEPAGCVWPQNLAAAVPGVVFLQEKVAIDPNTNEECTK